MSMYMYEYLSFSEGLVILNTKRKEYNMWREAWRAERLWLSFEDWTMDNWPATVPNLHINNRWGDSFPWEAKEYDLTAKDWNVDIRTPCW